MVFMIRLLQFPAQARAVARGFTLIELLVTVSVAAILLSMAVPAFNSFVLNDRDVGQINSLVGSLNYARSEAIKRASPNGIIVCPSANGLTCSGTAWSGGWIVLDLNPADPPPLVLQTVPALNGSNTLTAVGAAAGITFLSSGLVSAALTIRVCDRRGASAARDVEVNVTGRVAASQTAGQAVSGAALVCP
jgi:type IV fimbrial biogenesis protein FimT